MPKPSAFYLLFLFTFTLTGCVSLAPTEMVQPDAHLPTSLNDSTALVETDVVSIGWRHYFNDPTLIDLISLALNNNRDLKLAALKVQESQKQYGVEQSNFYPQIDGQASINYQGQNRQQQTKNYSAQLGLSYELDFFGRIKNMSEAQLQQYLSTKQAQRSTYILLISQVAKNYLDIQTKQQQLAIMDSLTTSYRQSLVFVESELTAGQSNYLAYQQAKGLIETAMSERTEKQRELTLAKHQLANLMGTLYNEINIASDMLQISHPLSGNLSSTLLLQRPDIMQAEYQIKASFADVNVARAAFFPSITLTGNLGNSSTELSDLLSGATAWSLLPKINLPLFNGNKNKLDLAIAEIRHQQAVIDYEKIVYNAFTEVADLLTQRSSFQHQSKIQQQYIDTLNISLALAQQSYLNGSTSYLTILDTQRAIFSAKQTLLTLKQHQQESEIDLFAALGGGSDI